MINVPEAYEEYIKKIIKVLDIYEYDPKMAFKVVSLAAAMDTEWNKDIAYKTLWDKHITMHE